jgi:ribosome maturation factor RimP
MERRLTSKVCELIAPVVEALGYELWGCEIAGLGRHTILRVYIDSEHGITLDDCSRVSNQISGILDVEDVIVGTYDLEVSSPGLERLLFKEEHYRRFIGTNVQIKLLVPKNGRRNYTGKIKGVAENEVELLVDNAVVKLPIDNIARAKILPEF